MKRLFIVFINLMFIMCLASCGEIQDKINIDFIIEGKSYLVEINKGTSINNEIIPLSNKIKIIELYYDEDMKNKYDDSILNEDTKIYVKSMGEQKLYNKVCEAYFNKFIKPIRENSAVEDVWVFRYLGTYKDSYVAILLDKENCIFPDVVLRLEIEDIIFTLSYGYEIYVYNKGELMYLNIAYENQILAYEDIVQIHNNYCGKK